MNISAFPIKHVFSLALFLICLMIGLSARAQTVGLAAEAKLLQVMANVDPDLASNRQTLNNRHYPYVIFIPGILGSKIFKHKDGKKKLVWGDTIIEDNDLFYDPNEDITTEILESLSIIKEDVYGKTLKFLKYQNFGLKSLEVFHYDWRADNRLTASNFHTWLCQKKAEIGKRPITFIAHSMGGLVLKYWFAKHHGITKCAESDVDQRSDLELSIFSVIFLGTPHLGSPKTIRVFADGFKLVVRDNDISGKLFGRLDKRVLAANLNRYGASFPSVYQLLPFYKSPDPEVAKCLNVSQVQKLPPPVRIRVPGSPENDRFFRFKAEAWKEIGWPAAGIPKRLKETYYEDFLPKALRNAIDFLCTVAKVNLPGHIIVQYIVGDEQDTEASYLFEIRDGSNPKGVLIGSSTVEVKGDGTVPAIIAGDIKKTTPFSYNVKWSQHDHAKLVKEEYLFKSISTLFEIAQWNVTHIQASLSPENSKRLARVHDVAKVFVPVGNNFLAKQPDWIVSTNTKIATNLGLTTDRLIKLADLNNEPAAKLSLYGVAANLQGTSLIDKFALASETAKLGSELGYPSAAGDAGLVAKWIGRSLLVDGIISRDALNRIEGKQDFLGRRDG